MSSTLCMRKTPKPTKDEWHFELPIKGIFARRFYDHDGTLGGGLVTIGPDDLSWLEGVIGGLATAGTLDKKELADLRAIREHIHEGGTVDMWFEV